MVDQELPDLASYASVSHCYTPAIGTALSGSPNANWGMLTSQLQGQQYNKEMVTKAFSDKEENMNKRRLVKVFIVDQDEDLPIDRSILFQSPEKLTDATDQELFFDIPIRDLLEKHNELRKTIKDKEASKEEGETVYLEEIRIRDLKMIVNTILEF